MPTNSGPTTLRFQVYVSKAHPELREELAQLPPRARPERLRTLALLGLSAMRTPPAAIAPPAERPLAPEPEDPLDQRRKQLMQRFASHG